MRLDAALNSPSPPRVATRGPRGSVRERCCWRAGNRQRDLECPWPRGMSCGRLRFALATRSIGSSWGPSCSARAGQNRRSQRALRRCQSGCRVESGRRAASISARRAAYWASLSIAPARCRSASSRSRRPSAHAKGAPLDAGQASVERRADSSRRPRYPKPGIGQRKPGEIGTNRPVICVDVSRGGNRALLSGKRQSCQSVDAFSCGRCAQCRPDHAIRRPDRHRRARGLRRAHVIRRIIS